MFVFQGGLFSRSSFPRNKSSCAIKCSWQSIPRHCCGAINPKDLERNSREGCAWPKELSQLHVRNSLHEELIYISDLGTPDAIHILTNSFTSSLKDTHCSTFFLFQNIKNTTSVKMDAIVQAILNLSKLEVSLIKIEDATPE